MFAIDRIKDQIEKLTQTVLQMKENQVPETAAREAATNGLSQTDKSVEQNTADIDYIMMMEDL